MTEIGSRSWRGADEIEEGSDLRARATAFVRNIDWDALASLATQTRATECVLSPGYSLGHFNTVRRLTFTDGVNWVARLRLPPLPTVFGGREAMSVADCMSVEIATMNYIRYDTPRLQCVTHSSIANTNSRSKTDMLVPEVFAHDLSVDNIVGAPYILMSYIHGTVAAELQEARGCKQGVFGTPEQDHRFWSQMAKYQVQFAALTFDKIGALRQIDGQISVGPETETGEGPWDTPMEYYTVIAHYRLKVAQSDAEMEVRQSDSFSLPLKFPQLMQLYESSSTGPYSLANRDLGAHNVLVDEEFNIVGLIDFDGVMAAPDAVVAQFPTFMGIDRAVPGYVETNEFAVKRIEKTGHLLPKYVALVRAELDNTRGKGNKHLADLLESNSASIVQGLIEYGQHQDFINDSWMSAYDKLLEASEGSTYMGGCLRRRGPGAGVIVHWESGYLCWIGNSR
jgi:hypothetical protein